MTRRLRQHILGWKTESWSYSILRCPSSARDKVMRAALLKGFSQSFAAEARRSGRHASLWLAMYRNILSSTISWVDNKKSKQRWPVLSGPPNLQSLGDGTQVSQVGVLMSPKIRQGLLYPSRKLCRQSLAPNASPHSLDSMH